ncbi:hypothetical protein CIL05_19950 [Virgibacillus profundi]|uniref:Uncharacterized protein n=1 Tax=Virgibacillus profundi TaxID=2024555 RepID=A0A2A2I961_9BACI|nr:DUF3231 family protein [Virgibacillus profundi]PAV27824.1 hypothetical protein CIL05_19950 [Virgibacillus profundi]PXY51951.1 DUF3231 domain-containing protein [Virgibacillus profundi]
MESNKEVNLTASEIAEVWGAYMNASLTSTVLSYFIEKVEDEDISPVLEQAQTLSQSQLKKLTSIFEQENKPIPIGFTNEDVNLEAPRLYTDNYFLQYVFQMGMLGMASFSAAVGMSTREDIYQFFSEGLTKFNELHETALSVSKSKGLYNSPPSIPTPKEVDFVKKQSFLTGWFGERRPLTALEIASLFSNIVHNSLGVATLTGFSQVAKSKEVTEYISRGMQIAKKHVNVFSSILNEQDVPAPMGSDSMVTDSNNIAPFSDKLMLFHVTGMIALGIGFYGLSISTNIRRDLVANYTRLTAEIALYSEDGANLMIDNEWLEEPPRMVDRDELAKSNTRKE